MKNKFSKFINLQGKYLTSLLIALVLGVGQMWADTFVNLRTVDFTEMTKKTNFANGKNTISDAGYTDLEFYQKNTDKPLKLNNASGEGIDFSGQNIGNSHFVAIPLTGINGQLKVTVYHKYSSGKASFKLGLKTGTTTVTPSDYNTNAQTPKDAANADVSCYYTYGTSIISTATTAVLFVGEAGTSYTQIKKVVIETLAPTCTNVAAPTGLSCTAHTENSLTFGWTAAEHASSYDVKLWTNSGCSGDPVASANVTGTSKEFTSLSAATTYYCKVQSKGDGTTYCAEGGVTSAASGTTDTPSSPVDPEFTYTSSTYTLGDPALDLSTKLASTNTVGAITFAVSTADAGTTGASIANNKDFTATAAGTAIITVSQAASAGFKAKSQDITVTVEAAEPPCATLTPATSGETIAANDVVSLQTGSTGGSIKALTSNISYNTNGLLFGNNSSTKAEVTLNHLMKVGTVITATIYNDNNDKNRGLNLLNSSGTSKATWTKNMIGDHVETYTVVAGDGLAGSNVFQLQRNNNAYLKSITVSNCGAELFALTSAVSVTGKATVTLNKSLVEAGGSATATYSDIDAAYDFDGWEITSGDATIADATINPAVITMGTTASTITLKLKAASVKYAVHFDSKGGSAVADQSIEAGGHAAVPTAPTKFKYTFGGWSETDGGSTPADLGAIAITGEKTFYAIWTEKVCPTSGTIFSFVSDGTKAPGSNTYCPASGVQGVVDIATYATVSGGLAQGVHTTTSNNPIQIQTSTSAVKLSHADGYFRALLECPLQEGDTIKFEKTNKVKMAFDSLRTKVVEIASGTGANKDYYIVPDTYAGEDTIMVYYNGSSVNLTALRVIRPAKYAVTFNMHEHGDQVAQQDILEGGKVSEPATTDITGWDFGGWYKESTFENAWDFENDVVSAVTELHAKWTEYVLNDDATLSSLSYTIGGGDPIAIALVTDQYAYEVELPFYTTATPVVAAVANDPNRKSLTIVQPTLGTATVSVTAEDNTTIKNYTVTFTVASAPTASSSINIEQGVLDNGKTWGYAAALSAAHIAIVDANELDSIDESKTSRNEPFLGLKFKKATSQFTIVVPASTELNVKFGSISSAAGLKVSVNGSTPAAPSLTDNVYTLGESEGVKEVVFTLDVADKTVVLKQIMVGEAIKAVTLPWKVSFDVVGLADAINPMIWTGTALTLPGVTNVESGYAFEKWNDGTADYLEGAEYTATNNVTLTAVYSMTVEDRLAELEFNHVAVEGFSPDQNIYYMTVPYSLTIPQITKAVAVDEVGGATATIQETFWDNDHNYYVAQAYVIPAGGTSTDAKFYQIRFTMNPKDGVSLIKVATTGGTNKTVTGLYAGDGDVNLSSSKKMDNSKYIGFILDGTTLQAGDRINVHTTQASSTGGSHIIFYNNMTDKNELYDTEEIGGAGDNIFTINAAMVGATTAYVYRSNADAAHQWNGYVNYIEVTRAMNPVLTAITIDERAGEIDPLDDKHFNVLIPYEAELAALNVEPTIVWNGAHATTPTTVISNEGAWKLGDNTYRVMDKDGDYTDYTITLTRDVQKFTVSYNTHDGSAVEPELVVAGEKLAAAPAAPTKEDYIFQGWSLSENGAIIDITDVTIDENKTFHAVWLYENPIILIKEDHSINYDDFITGVERETIEINDVEHDCVKFSGTVSNVNGVKDLTRVIAYNATTNKTRIKLSLYNNSTNSRTVQVKGLLEGSSEVVNLAAIELGNKEQKTSDYIEFNNAANRTIYIFIPSSAGDVRFLQVKVIESGDVDMKRAGEVGYSINFNQGRFFGVKDKTAKFEGLNVEVASSDCQPLQTAVVKLAETSISFDVTEIVKMSVTTNNNKTYYVTRGATGTSNETAKTGTTDFTLIPGKWFITAGSSNVEITNIAFSEATPDYTRENLNPAYLGTLCWTNDAVLTGGTLYEFAGKDEHNYLAFDEVEENLLVAGNPYIFMPENGNTEIKVYNINNVKLTEDQDPVNNMYGTITGKTLVPGQDNNMYYFSSNHIWAVKDFAVNIAVPAYYCYVDYEAVLADDEPAAAPAQGRRRVTMGVNGQNTTTGIGEIEASETPMKVMINGQIFIIRGEKMYDVTGKLVK